MLKFPILSYFQDDPAPYITAGLIVSADPDTGVTSLGYHRLMIKGRDRLGISLHSRKRLCDYQRRAEENGKNLPVACLLGVHPLISLASIGVIPRWKKQTNPMSSGPFLPASRQTKIWSSPLGRRRLFQTQGPIRLESLPNSMT